jgi:hypothetical protein
MNQKKGKNNNKSLRYRFRYGRLSVDSDDQQQQHQHQQYQHNQCNDVNVGNVACCDEMEKNQCCVDKNGNCVNYNANNNHDQLNGIVKDKHKSVTKQIDHKTITRLQAIAMSDDDEFGKYGMSGVKIETLITNDVGKFPPS